MIRGHSRAAEPPRGFLTPLKQGAIPAVDLYDVQTFSISCSVA